MATTLTVRWDDFEAAFIIGSPDSRYFVDTASGAVEYSSHFDDDAVRERVLRRASQPGWLEIPRPTEDDARAEVQSFIDAEPDADVRAALQAGFAEKHAFKGFNVALGRFPEVRRRWASHRLSGIHARLLAFTRRHDLAIDDERFRALSM